MDNPYDLHTWSKRYREESLQEADTRRREGLLRAKGERSAPLATTKEKE